MLLSGNHQYTLLFQPKISKHFDAKSRILECVTWHLCYKIPAFSRFASQTGVQDTYCALLLFSSLPYHLVFFDFRPGKRHRCCSVSITFSSVQRSTSRVDSSVSFCSVFVSDWVCTLVSCFYFQLCSNCRVFVRFSSSNLSCSI